MPTLIRSASLTNFTEIAQQCGLDPLALVREAGLPVKCLSDPDLKVDALAVGHLLEMAASRAAEPAFGLRMGESRQLSNLGPLGLLLRDEPTLRHALDAIVRHIRVHNEALVIRVEEVDQLVLIREEFVSDASVSRRQAVELAMAVTYRILSLFMGVTWRPRLVCFSHRAPAHRGVHHRVFGDKVEFGHEFNGMMCNRSDLQQPNPSADPVMARYAQELVQAQTVSAPTFTHQVRQLILFLLPLGQCNADVVAQHLGCNRRTITRRLAVEQTGFHALVNEHRCRMASQYLQDKSRPLAQVSALLGFSAPSAFSRWYRLQFGVRPRDA
jgi:AraC-like DNA-binding protein